MTFDPAGPRDAQDKAWFVAYGQAVEQRFVDEIAPLLGLPIRIHPDKAMNPYGPDLLIGGSQLADLKTKIRPFFTSEKLFGIPPTYAMSFNRKDYLRYREKYPSIVLYWWIVREPEERYGIKTCAIEGVWRVRFAELAARIEAGEAPLHEYQNRVNDQQGNGKSSYIFDLRTFEQLWRKR